MIVGYARVSTDGQTLDAQHTTLRAAGAEKVFAEKVSGAKTHRALANRGARRWRYPVNYSIGPPGEIDTRPAQCARNNLRQKRSVQIAS
jgi:hypothetical protein